MFRIYLENTGVTLQVPHGSNLFDILRANGAAPDAPCGGNGSCKKCRVLVDGVQQLACQTTVDRDLTVSVPREPEKTNILAGGARLPVSVAPEKSGYLLAFDLGTTTVVGCLMDDHGSELASVSMLNPQRVHGADVITRIHAALSGRMDTMTTCIRDGLAQLTQETCEKAGIQAGQIGVVCVVGNPCMQQLFLGLSVENLVRVPFAPVITKSSLRPAREFLPLLENAVLLTPPDISGYVGADTVACMLSTRMFEDDAVTLLVDIGTNGEMVLGGKRRMVTCSTAAGPALEGANIRFGMRAAQGAIDHVHVRDGALHAHVIGGGSAVGICGSGLIDVIACLLELKLLNARGRLQTTDELDGERIVRLSGDVCLTQNDIRETQLAKGAIAAGIFLMARELGITLDQIDRVLLAGAFGTYLDQESACRIGLLPSQLHGKIETIGNAAGSGAKMMACSKQEFARTDALIAQTEFIELAAVPDFQHEFARNMRFSEE